MIGATFARFQLLDRPVGIDKYLERWSEKKLRTIAEERGISAKLNRCDTLYVKEEIKLLAMHDSLPDNEEDDSPIQQKIVF